MRRKFKDLFLREKRFKREFRRQLRLLIVITLGFTIAFTWRQTVFDVSQDFVALITNITNSSALSILTSIFITLASVLLIYLTSYYLRNNTENY